MGDLRSLFCPSFSLSTICVIILLTKPCKDLIRGWRHDRSSIPEQLTMNTNAVEFSQPCFL